MKHLYEGTLIDTKDGIQFKTYTNSHPDGIIITRPKYIPQDKLGPEIFHSRFLFEKSMTRYNPFGRKEGVERYLKAFRKTYPQYIYKSPLHKREFFGVPEKAIERIHDPKAGLEELLRIPDKDLDKYLFLVKELILFIKKSGVSEKDMGITNSTLLGNYTFGRSDIDIMVFGKKNGWKVFNFLGKNKHPLMRWKTKKEWREYYRDHKIGGAFTESDFIFHNSRKKNEGIFGKHVFTIFCAEEKKELWQQWNNSKRYKFVGKVVIRGIVSDDYNSIVRPGGYRLKNAEIISGIDSKKIGKGIKEIVTYSLPLLHQAKKGERIEAGGILEKVVSSKNKEYYRLVMGYQSPYFEIDDGYIKTI